MAADMDALHNFTTEGYATNGVPRSSRYEIPDVVLHAPTTRRLRVLSIGAGVSGIMNSYYMQKQLENYEHVVYEKNADIGGTWLENRYPGCACDIPSHAYTLPFALNPEWPRFFSYSADIWKYLDKICDVFGLRKDMRFNHEVIGCYWKQDAGEWLVKIRQTRPEDGGTVREFEDRCHVLLHGTGLLNNFKWPDLEGMDRFKGRLIHTARWPADYQAAQWSRDRVAVIGSGASSIQTVPNMQPHARHLDVFVRTGVWFVQIANNFGHNHVYTPEQKRAFRAEPAGLVGHAKDIEDQVNGFFTMMYKGSRSQADQQAELRQRMADFIRDERLLKGFTPEFGVGCRRITPGDPYMHAIQKENVDVHFTPVAKITEKGLVGEDGVEREVDTIVCATGFDVSYRPRFPIVGRDGVDLADKWRACPEAYLGITVPGFPNFFTFIGPTWPVENGAVVGPLSQCAQYAIQVMKKIQSEHVRSIAPRQDVTDEFNAHVQEWIRHTVWGDSCRSWYKNNETGRVNAVWPGSSLHFIDALRQPRYEDYDVTYLGPAEKNRFAYLGMGIARNQVEPSADKCPYLGIDSIDPAWVKAAGLNKDKILEYRLDRVRRQWEAEFGRQDAAQDAATEKDWGVENGRPTASHWEHVPLAPPRAVV